MPDIKDMTVFNLDAYTAHEVFTRVKQHLLTQKARSVPYDGSPDCRYRTETGLQCAVGCLIPESRYTQDIEGKLWYSVDGNRRSCVYACEMLGGKRVHAPLLRRLQRVHDSDLVEEWPRRLYEIEREVLNGYYGTDCHDPRSYAPQDR